MTSFNILFRILMNCCKTVIYFSPDLVLRVFFQMSTNQNEMKKKYGQLLGNKGIF